MRRRIPIFVAIIQSILLLLHSFIYETWIRFWHPLDYSQVKTLRIATLILAVSFVAAQLLALFFYNFAVSLFYDLAAVWLGTLNFLFVASLLCWIAYPLLALLGLNADRPALVEIMFALAVLTAIYATVNAALPRVKRVSVKLPNLPDSWRGRVAALITDTHLGNVRGRRFISRIVATLKKLQPDVVFIPGDMFDGTKAILDPLTAPWKNISPPHGTYFVTGNHEEFSDPEKYLRAVAASGIRVLRNEKVEVDGLQILGVSYAHSTHAEHFSKILDGIAIDPNRASVLLLHVPHQLPISEKHGISLQVSGHTHGGQVFPISWIASRIWGKYVHGLNYFSAMAVYTSYGAGTWGPPMRFLTWPEIVLIHFE